jgi:internalin A
MERSSLLFLITKAAQEQWEELDLSKMYLSELPPEIGSLRQLKRLQLGMWDKDQSKYNRNGLATLPESIGQLTNLTSLDISSNRLNTLPESIGQLANLTSLNLSGNQLNALPESIGQLTSLTSLNLSGNQFNALPKSISQLTSLTSLNLSGNEFNALSESIGELIKLISLDLSSNKLNALPKSIQKLTKLTSLHLSYNKLNTIPELIGMLTRLTFLDISYNKGSILPKSIRKLTKLTSLDISGNELSTLPESIGQLTNLVSLNLSGNELSTLPESIGQLTKLTSLDLSKHKLHSLPESISQLTCLISLNLNSNKLENLPESIGELTNLTNLDLWRNKLLSLPNSTGQLINLTSLNISSNQLKTLPDSIGELTNLVSLDIWNNQLNTLPKSIGKLINLTSLHLWNNELNILPDSIGSLTRLTLLNLSSNRLSSLPKSIKKLTNLTSLDISSNKLNVLPDSISQLINLTSLNLSCNKFNVLPDLIGQLINLTSLNLSCNKFNVLPDLIGQLINLTSLNLSNNNLNSLPESIGKLIDLKQFMIHNNSLTQIPPEIIKRGSFAVRDYYRQRLEEKTDYIYEAKLILIGEGGAGKTSLANKLIDSKYQLKVEGSDNPEKSTEGIDVLRFNFSHPSGNTFRINIWDFGGQEIYHTTHQFFLTKRSLYLLVADTRQDNTDFNYWMEVVELLSEASPAIIIKNEKQDRPCQINENQLRGRFSSLEKILPTNLADNRGLPEILTAVQHHISQLPHIGQPLPRTWVRVRETLESDSRNYITQSEFLDLCNKHGFKRREDKLQLSSYLHDIGVCLHFQDDPILKNWIILRPEWGTTAVYTVLDTPQIQQTLGYFTYEDLAKIWAEDQYSEMHDELLQLMMRFKLCYEIPHCPYTYIAPQLLSSNQPEHIWDDTDNLILRYHYDFMPKGMLTRFIVEMHSLIDNDLVWKEGVILYDSITRASVIENYSKNEICIRVAGFPKKDLLTRIRHEFSKIHDSYEKLRYQELIPCNCLTCKGSQNPHAYVLQKLQERIQNQSYETECDQKPYNKVNIHSLINDAIGHSQVTQPTINEQALEYSREAYEDMRDITKLAVSRNITVKQEQTMTDESKYSNDLKGANIGNFANEVNDSARQQANQHNYAAQPQSLTDAAKEIQELLDQITATDQTNNSTLIAVKAIEAIEKNPTLKDRIINAGKEAGFAAIDAAVDHPAIKIVTAAIKGAIEA